jgi:hypothetical protein
MSLTVTDCHPQKAIIKSGHFSSFDVHIEGISDSGMIKGTIIKPGDETFSIKILRTDGWQISIGDKDEASQGKETFITRVYLKSNGVMDYNVDKQYLAKNGEWKNIPIYNRSLTLFEDAMRIPIFATENKEVKV